MHFVLCIFPTFSERCTTIHKKVMDAMTAIYYFSTSVIYMVKTLLYLLAAGKA